MRALIGCLVVAALTLSGCSSTVSPLKVQAGGPSDTPQWYPDYQSAGHLPEDVIDPEQTTALTEKQKAAFRTWYQYPSSQKLTPAEQVVEFLQQSVWGFDFRGDTLVASHAMEENAGNCLSLALLTAALADEVGVDITFQEDISRPVYKQKGPLMLMAKHVRATVRDSAEQLADKPGMTPQTIDVDYFSDTVHGDMVDRTRLLAMYYRNKAAEFLARQNVDAALAYADTAWQLDRTSASSINLMAVVLGHHGQQKAAGDFYQFAIEHRYDNLMLRENYVAYLTRHGKNQQARQIADNMDQAVENNPYNWIWRARQAVDERHFDLALRLFHKAREAAPYLVESYHGLARVYVETGRFGHATAALEKAVDVAWNDDEKQQFKNKLLVLNTMLESGKR